MSQGNGSENFQERLAALEKAHAELEDSFILMTHLETKQSQMLKEQAEYMANHESRLRALDDRIEKLVSGIGELVTRLPGSDLEQRVRSLEAYRAEAERLKPRL